ncbi:hypothetical protein SDC9_212510 [bioreactor metagenome]|uniref:Uncharacterized protein n=1 Tax=bioreactor metagenome TaxID=1076179 RepID=A0A645K0P9_9ZZZZ
MRRPDQFAGLLVGPAVDRADHRPFEPAGALQHDRLTVAADVGHLPDAGIRPDRAAVEQHLTVVLPFLGTVVTRFRHHQLVAGIARTGIEDELLLQRVNPFIEIPVHRQLGNCRGQPGRSRHVGHS